MSDRGEADLVGRDDAHITHAVTEELITEAAEVRVALREWAARLDTLLDRLVDAARVDTSRERDDRAD